MYQQSLYEQPTFVLLSESSLMASPTHRSAIGIQAKAPSAIFGLECPIYMQRRHEQARQYANHYLLPPYWILPPIPRPSGIR